jgi:hypothetical protein
MNAEQRLLETLFENPNHEHIDIKFCRGTDSDISPEALCDEANKALLQIDLGLVETRPTFGDKDRKQIDVATL